MAYSYFIQGFFNGFNVYSLSFYETLYWKLLLELPLKQSQTCMRACTHVCSPLSPPELQCGTSATTSTVPKVVLQSVRSTQSQSQRARLRTELLTEHAVPKQLRNVSLASFDDFCSSVHSPRACGLRSQKLHEKVNQYILCACISEKLQNLSADLWSDYLKTSTLQVYSSTLTSFMELKTNEFALVY